MEAKDLTAPCGLLMACLGSKYHSPGYNYEGGVSIGWAATTEN